MQIEVKLPKNAFQFPAKIKAGLQTGINVLTGDITTMAMAKAPRKTGTLKRSIHAEVGSFGGGFTGKVIQDTGVAKYGPWVHNGTGLYGPHETYIVPVKATWLRWRGPDGKIWKARKVKGMKARPFMKEAYDLYKPQAGEIVKSFIMKEVNG